MNHLGYSAIIHPSPNRSANSAAIRHPRQCATREAGDYYGRMRQALGSGHSGVWKRGMTVSWSSVKKQENRGSLDTSRKALMASRAGSWNFCDSESQKLPRFSCFFTLLQLTAIPRFQTPLCPLPKAPPPPKTSRSP